jgi:hypothetical protein
MRLTIESPRCHIVQLDAIFHEQLAPRSWGILHIRLILVLRDIDYVERLPHYRSRVSDTSRGVGSLGDVYSYVDYLHWVCDPDQ